MELNNYIGFLYNNMLSLNSINTRTRLNSIQFKRGNKPIDNKSTQFSDSAAEAQASYRGLLQRSVRAPRRKDRERSHGNFLITNRMFFKIST